MFAVWAVVFVQFAAMKNLGHFLLIKGGNILNNQLIIGSCCAHVLSHLAQYALYFWRAVVDKVRQSVKFVKTADAHEEKFLELKRHLQVPNAELIVNDQAKRNISPYQQLYCIKDNKIRPVLREDGIL